MPSSSRPPDLSAWPGLELVAALSEGPRQQLWRGEQDGRVVVVHRSRRSPQALDWELRLRSWLAPRMVLSPQLLPTARGGLRFGRTYVEEFVEGHPPSGPGEEKLVFSTVNRLHQLTGEHRQRPGFLSARALVGADRGGDVDLALIPEDMVVLLRRAWSVLPATPQAVIHADLRWDNILIQHGRCVLLDWDEARVDSLYLDLVEFPNWDPPTSSGLRRHELELAALAWEVAAGWRLEPQYARSCLRRLRAQALEAAGS